jgi:hypothetical protein
MLRFALAVLLAATLVPDDKEDLAKAAEKSRALENYAFKGRIAIDGVPFLPEPMEFAGAYVKDRGFTATMGPFGTVFKVDKKVAVKDPDGGTWILLAKGAKVGDGPLAEQIPILARGLRPPHEELKKYEERFKELRKKDGEAKIGDIACVVYEGALTEPGVRGAIPGGLGFLLGKAKCEGTGRAWVGDGGRILRFEVDGKIEIDDKDQTTELKFSRTTEFSEIGKATLEVPAEVKKLFED